MAPRHPDPFEGVRFDERFVRSARFLEPAARDRTGPLGSGRGARCAVVPAPRGLQGLLYRLFVSPPRPAPRARRLTWVLAVLTVSVGVISLTFVALRQTARGVPVATPPQPASGVTTPGGAVVSASAGALGDRTHTAGGLPSIAAPLAADLTPVAPGGFDLTPTLFASLRPGVCLVWPTLSMARPEPTPVSCTDPHIDEVTRTVDLSARYDRWPGAAELRTVAADVCAGAPRVYAGTLDIAPHRISAVVWPDNASWERGVRGLACTVRSDDLSPRAGRSVVIGSVRS